MRISDWSSDVCSSDLAHPALRETADGGAVRFLRPYGARRSRPRHSRQRGCAAASAYRPVDGHLSVRWRNHASRQCRIGTADPADRTSVVKGKSVSVRVDLGGGRLFKKKKKKKQ